MEEFKRIYKKKFKEELSNQDSLDKAIKLLNLVKAIYKPMTQKEYEELQKRRKETEDK